MRYVVYANDKEMSEEIREQLAELFDHFFPLNDTKGRRIINRFNDDKGIIARFLLLDDQTVVSYAAVLKRELLHQEIPFQLAGIGGMFVFQKICHFIKIMDGKF